MRYWDRESAGGALDGDAAVDAPDEKFGVMAASFGWA